MNGTLYKLINTAGDVFWTSQGNHPLPDNIIKRFDGKVIAITGYEQDQVITLIDIRHAKKNPAVLFVRQGHGYSRRSSGR